MGYNKITIRGNQTCDYLYVERNDNFDNSKFEAVASEPEVWTENTLLFAKFDGDATAGNSALTDEMSGYEVRRKKSTDSYTEYVTTLNNNSGNYVIDYAVKNHSAYTYYLYPNTVVSNSGVLLSPYISEQVVPKWDYWCLLVVDESDKENVFYLDKMFKFELNLTVDDMNNNANATVTPNFTRHPTVQHSFANYWSGSLSALCGIITCKTNEYVETTDMIDELKELPTDSKRKFLKDMDGNMWEVEITSPISISRDNATVEKIKTVKVSWAEVGNADGISIVNKPNAPTTSWVLTRTGSPKPYIEYRWESGKVWNNMERWTNNYTNMGKSITGEEGNV